MVEAIPLIDNLDMPHTPCPDVHPLASRVPMPTNNPANINIITLVVVLVSASTSKIKM